MVLGEQINVVEIRAESLVSLDRLRLGKRELVNKACCVHPRGTLFMEIIDIVNGYLLLGIKVQNQKPSSQETPLQFPEKSPFCKGKK